MEDATAAQLAPFLARYGLVVQLSNSKGRCLIASRAFKQDMVCFVFLHRSGGACAGALRCSLGWQLAAQAMRSVFFTVKQSEEMLSMQECFLLLHSMPEERMVVA
jgi:hypothetical protein